MTDQKDRTKGEKKERRKKPLAKWMLIFALFWLVIIGVSFAVVSNQARQYNQLRAEALRVQANVDNQKAINEALYDQVAFFDSDAYIEARARERLGMVRPTEIVIRNIATD